MSTAAMSARLVLNSRIETLFLLVLEEAGTLLFLIYGSHAEILQKRMHRGERHHTDGKRQDAAQSLYYTLRSMTGFDFEHNKELKEELPIE